MTRSVVPYRSMTTCSRVPERSTERNASTNLALPWRREVSLY